MSKVTIEMDSIDYQLFKDYYERAILHHQKKQEIRESFFNDENDEYVLTDLEVAERVYWDALDDLFRVLQKTFVMLVDLDPSLPFNGESPEAPVDEVKDMSKDTVRIEIDSIDYRFLKASFDRVISHQEQKEIVNKSYLIHECEESDVKVAELVYLGAVNDFIRQIKDTFGSLVDTDLSLLVDAEQEAPAEQAPEALAEQALEESELSADNISDSDASCNDISNNDASDEFAAELPFPIVPHDDAPYTLGLSLRVITVLLSDEDCDKLFMKLGVRNATVGDLVQNFIRDLVYSDDCNGSDECIFANQWFERCWISHDFNLLMGFLNSNGIDPYDDLICYMESIEHGESDLLEYEVNPRGFDPEEMEFLKEDIEDWKEHICKIRRQFLATYPDADWVCEFEDLKNWYKEREIFKNITVRYLNKNK